MVDERKLHGREFAFLVRLLQDNACSEVILKCQHGTSIYRYHWRLCYGSDLLYNVDVKICNAGLGGVLTNEWSDVDLSWRRQRRR